MTQILVPAEVTQIKRVEFPLAKVVSKIEDTALTRLICPDKIGQEIEGILNIEQQKLYKHKRIEQQIEIKD